MISCAGPEMPCSTTPVMLSSGPSWKIKYNTTTRRLPKKHKSTIIKSIISDSRLTGARALRKHPIYDIWYVAEGEDKNKILRDKATYLLRIAVAKNRRKRGSASLLLPKRSTTDRDDEDHHSGHEEGFECGTYWH